MSAQPLDAAPSRPEPCARCAGDSEVEIASLWLCLDCYHIAGSTCAGIGRLPETAQRAGVIIGGVQGATGATDQVC